MFIWLVDESEMHIRKSLPDIFPFYCKPFQTITKKIQTLNWPVWKIIGDFDSHFSVRDGRRFRLPEISDIEVPITITDNLEPEEYPDFDR